VIVEILLIVLAFVAGLILGAIAMKQAIKYVLQKQMKDAMAVFAGPEGQVDIMELMNQVAQKMEKKSA
jgi:uncharacterized protein YneF (UPF0154 family)